MTAIKPCPFCGNQPDINDNDTLYPSGSGWKFDEELQMRTYYHNADECALSETKNNSCYGMHCNTTSGGCGAEIHADSKDEAISAWNRRSML